MKPNDQNLQRGIWKKLTRNAGALFGLVVISISLLIALFAYLLAPDRSPHANRMILEIGGRKPGFRQEFLLVKKERQVVYYSPVIQWLAGKEDSYNYIPINRFEYLGDSLVVWKFIDEGIEERFAYFLPQSKRSSNDPYKIETRRFLLGTDKYGRDILSRLLIGVRVSLAVGLVTVLISLSIGVFLGAIAGYFGGRMDDLVMWFINIIWSIPTLLMVFALTLVLGKGFWQVFIAIGLTMWVNVARIIRGQILSVRELEYVEAGKALGFSSLRIIFRHILPNVMGPVLVVAAANFASAIVIESGLSFLALAYNPRSPAGVL